MKLLFKQRLFSWLDSYDIFGEDGQVLYTVKGQLAWGHCLKIFDVNGIEVGTVKERVFSFLPKFEIYLGQQYMGCIRREFSFFVPRYIIECNGWQVEGNIFEWDYSIVNAAGRTIASISKDLFRLTDTYLIDVADPRDSLCTLMLVLAIDAEKCSRDD